jgi:hypothetical protein
LFLILLMFILSLMDWFWRAHCSKGQDSVSVNPNGTTNTTNSVQICMLIRYSTTPRPPAPRPHGTTCWSKHILNTLKPWFNISTSTRDLKLSSSVLLLLEGLLYRGFSEVVSLLGVKGTSCCEIGTGFLSELWFYLPPEIHVCWSLSVGDKNWYFSAVRSPIELKLGRDLELVSRISVQVLVSRLDCLFTFCKQTNKTRRF